MNVPLSGGLRLHTLGLGATGLSCNQTNVIPKTFRRYVDAYESGRSHHGPPGLRRSVRFNRYVDSGAARVGRRWRSRCSSSRVARGTAQAVPDAADTRCSASPPAC